MILFKDLRNMKVLVLGPHPDDELMSSGTLSKMIESGAEVYHWFLSLCSPSILTLGYTEDALIQECNRSRECIGIDLKNCGNYDFDVRIFKEKRQEILDVLLHLRNTITPSLVFLPSRFDVHQDHNCLYEEGVRAFKNSSILGYESPWNMMKTDNNLYVSLHERHILKKIEAVKSYQSQKNRNYMDEEFIRSLATVRGVQAGTKYAESFEIIKLIW